jgi:radical SAM-linked protein
VGPELRFLANLDMIHAMERALRRARVPYALSEGFNPHIKLSLGTVLPVGLWGEREYFDIELKSEMSGEDFIHRLNAVFPVGLSALQAVAIAPSAPSIMGLVNAASYVFKVEKADEAILHQVNMIMNRPELVVASRGKKKNRTKDLRPGIHKITVMTEKQFDIIEIWVSTGEPVNVRFDELADILGACGIPAGHVIDVWRSGNYCQVNEQFYTPLEQVKRL